MSTALELVNSLLDFVSSKIGTYTTPNSASQTNKFLVVKTRYEISDENIQLGPQAIYYKLKYDSELIETAKSIGRRGKGILAADESTGTIKKRLSSISVESNEENRRKYRELLFTTKGLNEYISGVIMYDETIRQKTKNNVPFPQILKNQGIITGIKVDLGAKNMPGYPNDKYTQGLTDLHIRAPQYYKLGARFAKWRAVLIIQNGYISDVSIQENAWTLARYSRICQEYGLVPIVEPEILMDGNHSIEICQYWTEKVLSSCYKALIDQEVLLEGTILKCNMVLNGNKYNGKKSIKNNAQLTIKTLLRCVPSAVPSINFLSGGQSEEEATLNLNEMNKLYTKLPWTVSFSFGRALQKSCLQAWLGKDENIEKAQQALLLRAKANSMAQLGKYNGFAATEESKKALFVSGYVY